MIVKERFVLGEGRAYPELEEDVEIADPFLAIFEIVEVAGIWISDCGLMSTLKLI